MSRVGKTRPDRGPGHAGRGGGVFLWTALLFLPAEWAPDSQRFAFLARQGDSAYLAAGWLFGPTTATADPGKLPPPAPRCDLWVANVETGSATRIDQSEGLFSQPCWAPDGRSLVYVHFLPTLPVDWSANTLGGSLTWLRRYRDGQTEVLRSRTGSFPTAALLALPKMRSDWSPNGLVLAMPELDPERLIVFATDAPANAAELPTASLPAFSPDCLCLAFHQQNPAGIAVVPVGRWSERRLVLDVANPVQPVSWERTSGYFLAMRVVGNIDPRSTAPLQVELMRVAAATGEKQIVQRHSVTPKEEDPLLDVFFAYSPRSESLLLPLYQDGRSVGIEWQIAGNPLARWHPVDDEAARWPIHLGAPTFSPDGRRFAFRFGPADWSAPLGVCEIERRSTSLWAPTDSARINALLPLVEALKDWLLEPNDSPEKTGTVRVPLVTPTRPTTRPVPTPVALFPFPSGHARLPAGMAGAEPVDPIRREAIERLAQYGIELARRPPAANDPLRLQFLESELLFAYTLGWFDQAITAIDRLEAIPDGDYQRRLVLEVIRAQCQASLGKYASALQTTQSLAVERHIALRAGRNFGERWELRLLALPAADESWTGTAADDPLISRLRTIEDLCSELVDTRSATTD